MLQPQEHLQKSLRSLVYLHEHAESSFKEIGEAWWHVLNINRIGSIRIIYIFHYLFQQWFVRSLHKKNNKSCVTCFISIKGNKVIILERKPFRKFKKIIEPAVDFVTLTANGVYQQSIKLKRQEDGHTFTLPHGRHERKWASGFSGIFLQVLQHGTATGLTLCCPSRTQISFPL